MIVLVVLGSYFLTSFILFKYPSIVHRKKNLKFFCRHISHRGGAGENLENTLTAFEYAVQQGTDMLELDVQLTKDGEVVVSHDSNLLRMAGVDKTISEVDYKDLPPLRSALPVDYNDGKLGRPSPDRKIPLLREVFERFPDLPINVDIKTNNDELIDRVETLIRQYDRTDKTVWGNFSDVVTSKCFSKNPGIPLFFSAKKVFLLVFLAYTGLLPFIPLRESCFEILMPSVAMRNPGIQAALQRKRVMFVLKIVDFMLMKKFIFSHLQKRGIQTYLWVLNEPEDFQRAFDLGATGVMTDYPSRLKSFLDEHPEIKSKSQ